MNFLVDNQLPPALARFIQTEFKLRAVHVIDVGLRDASDAEIWSYVSKSDSVLKSKDEDFVNMFCNYRRPSSFGLGSAIAVKRSYWTNFGGCGLEYWNGSRAVIAL